MTKSYFLYKIKNNQDWIRIFKISEDGNHCLIDMHPGSETRVYVGDLQGMRDLWRKSKQYGFKDKAICDCGIEYDAGWYFHVGHCHRCEAQQELEAQFEWDVVREAMDG